MRQARQTGTSPARRNSSLLPHVAVLMLLLITAAGCAQLPAHSPSEAQRAPALVEGVPAARLARLARCVDITRWFWAVGDAAPNEALPTHFATYMSDGDL